MTIWRYWVGPDEPEVQQLPDQRIVHDEDLAPHLRAWLDDLMSLSIPADAFRHRSNMVRWHLLWRYGGVWLDHDVTVRTAIPSGVWVCARLPRLIPNVYAISLPAQHPLAARMTEEIAAKSWPARPCPWVSGDRVLRSVIDDYPDVGRSRLNDWGHHARATSRHRPATFVQ